MKYLKVFATVFAAIYLAITLSALTQGYIFPETYLSEKPVVTELDYSSSIGSVQKKDLYDLLDLIIKLCTGGIITGIVTYKLSKLTMDNDRLKQRNNADESYINNICSNLSSAKSNIDESCFLFWEKHRNNGKQPTTDVYSEAMRKLLSANLCINESIAYCYLLRKSEIALLLKQACKNVEKMYENLSLVNHANSNEIHKSNNKILEITYEIINECYKRLSSSIST